MRFAAPKQKRYHIKTRHPWFSKEEIMQQQAMSIKPEDIEHLHPSAKKAIEAANPYLTMKEEQPTD